jgi:hypothetical protein
MYGPVIPHTMQDLEAIGTPGSVKGNMEALEFELYDTQVYTSAATLQLTFFTAADVANGMVTNMRAAGQLPNPDFFAPRVVTLDVIGAAPGNFARLTDMYDLVYGTTAGQAPYSQFFYAGKEYCHFSLASIHAAGGPTGFTTVNATEYANNGIIGRGRSMGIGPDGDPSIFVLPLQAFRWVLNWPGAVTLTGNVAIRLGMHGTYYRQIR